MAAILPQIVFGEKPSLRQAARIPYSTVHIAQRPSQATRHAKQESATTAQAEGQSDDGAEILQRQPALEGACPQCSASRLDELLSARQRQEDSQRPGLVGQPAVLSVAGLKTPVVGEEGAGQIYQRRA